LTLLVAILVLKFCGPHAGLSLGWEYRIESPADLNLPLELQQLGSGGWELVFARRATSSRDAAAYEMIFKRPRSIWGMLK
jgi:hypothetical protein